MKRAGKGLTQVSFRVIVKGERLSGSYTLSTALQALTKAESMLGHGAVSIIDPHQDEWTPEHFHFMLRTLGKIPPVRALT